MIDLKTKQAFWAEQLPSFKEKYWIPGHLDVLKFDMNAGCFDIAEGVKTDLSEEDLFDIYHRVNSGWAMWKKALTFMREKAQAVPEGYVLVEKSKIETWWQDAEEPENFASRIEDMPSLGQYLNGDEIMEIIEHHTIHLPSKSIYGVWVDKDGDRSFCTGTLEECQALVASESGAEG